MSNTFEQADNKSDVVKRLAKRYNSTVPISVSEMPLVTNNYRRPEPGNKKFKRVQLDVKKFLKKVAVLICESRHASKIAKPRFRSPQSSALVG